MKKHKRIEVVVLAARNLSDTKDDCCRRQIELSILSLGDPEGESFGVKKSLWSQPIDNCAAVRFGRSGLRSTWPLEGPKASDIVETKRFHQSAELRVRVMVSGVSTQNALLVGAQSYLPASMVQSFSKEFDKATAYVEAETRIPLEEILAGTPDAHQSGWMNLQRCKMSSDNLNCATPQLWMQVFSLPAFESIVPRLDNEYEAEGEKLPSFQPFFCQWREAAVPSSPSKTATSPSSKSSTSMPQAVPAAPGQPLTAVVPAGVEPGETFSVKGPPTMHQMQCPAGMKPGDKWQAISPTGHPIAVTVPENVREGQVFQVLVEQVIEMRCPDEATPGSVVEVHITPTSGSKVMQVQCPPDLGPGDEMLVVVRETGQSMMVKIPPGVLPHQMLAVIPPPPPVVETAAPTQPSVGLTDATPTKPEEVDLLALEPSEEVEDPPLRQEKSKVDIDAAGASAASVCPKTLEPTVMLPTDLFSPATPMQAGYVAASTSAETSVTRARTAAEVASASLDLAALYEMSAPLPANSWSDEIEAEDRFEALKCLDVSPVSRARADTRASNTPGSLEIQESLQDMQDSLLTGFSESFKPSM